MRERKHTNTKQNIRKRSKWSLPIRKYWKISENGMIKWSDLIICDSKCIEQYIREEYKKYDPHTTFIAYGADTEPSVLADDDESYVNWLNEKGFRPNEYYLVVGRFVLQTKMGREGTNACSLTAHFLCRCLR